MLNNRTDILDLIKEFDALCKKEGIWYSLANETLLGAVRHGGFVPWIKKFTVMIDVESLLKLEKVAPHKLISSQNVKEYNKLTYSYISAASNWRENQPFIEIVVLVPTTVEKIKKFQSFSSLIKNALQNRKPNTKNAVVDLIDKNHFNGYLLLFKRKQNFKTTWIQAMPTEKEVVMKNFVGMELPVIKNYDQILSKFYGPNYMNEITAPKKWIEYPSPLEEVGVE